MAVRANPPLLVLKEKADSDRWVACRDQQALLSPSIEIWLVTKQLDEIGVEERYAPLEIMARTWAEVLRQDALLQAVNYLVVLLEDFGEKGFIVQFAALRGMGIGTELNARPPDVDWIKSEGAYTAIRQSDNGQIRKDVNCVG